MKSNSYFTVPIDTIDLSLRPNVSDEMEFTKNMISQIIKSVKNNFEINYHRSSTILKSKRLSDPPPITHKNDSTIDCNYRRCLVEDFMIINKDTNLLFLVPTQYSDDNLSFWKNVLDENTPIVTFGKKTYNELVGRVHSCPYREKAMTGIPRQDLVRGMGIDNYGVHITFNKSTELITWSEILNSLDEGIQAWQQTVGLVRSIHPSISSFNLSAVWAVFE